MILYLFRLDQLLAKNEIVDKFLEALSYVCVPAAILRYYVDKIMKCQHLDEKKRIHDNVMKNILNGKCNSKDVNSLQGNMYKKVDKYKKDFIKIIGKH